MNSVTTRGCRVSHAGAPPRPLEKWAGRPRDARRTTPAWLFDTQTQFFFPNANLSTKPGQAQREVCMHVVRSQGLAHDLELPHTLFVSSIELLAQESDEFLVGRKTTKGPRKRESPLH